MLSTKIDAGKKRLAKPGGDTTLGKLGFCTLPRIQTCAAIFITKPSECVNRDVVFYYQKVWEDVPRAPLKVVRRELKEKLAL